jgi:hypothetical protein
MFRKLIDGKKKQITTKIYVILLIQIVGEHGSIVNALRTFQFEIVETGIDNVLFGHCTQTLKNQNHK